MSNIFGNPYDLTTVTVDGQKYLLTNEDYRWLMERLREVDKQYDHRNVTQDSNTPQKLK